MVVAGAKRISAVPESVLFHMQRNRPIRENELLPAAAGALSEALPSSWSIVSGVGERRPGGRVDMVLALTASDGALAKILVEAKRVVEPRDVPGIVRRLQAHRGTDEVSLMVAAPYLSPRVRELLQEAGVGWFDSVGNLRLQLDRPSVFIDRTGASHSPFTDTDFRRLKSLKGPGAARVVRALLDEATPVGVRALADLAGVGAATSSRVLELLVREDLVERDDGGRVVAVRKLSLARRWCSDYGLAASNQAVAMLAPRGIDQVLSNLRGYEGTYAITAEAATRPYLPPGQAAVAPLALLTLYVPDATTAAATLQLRPVDRGANVVLVEPFDAVVYRGAQVTDRVRYAAPSQVVADLLTGPGRAPQEGASLIDVLAATDDGWTTR